MLGNRLWPIILLILAVPTLTLLSEPSSLSPSEWPSLAAAAGNINGSQSLSLLQALIRGSSNATGASPRSPSYNGPPLTRSSSFPGRRGYAQCKTNYNFDYSQLTLQWAPGACSTSPRECKHEETRHFTIHGMWPTIRGTEEPAFCCFNNVFQWDVIKPLESDLNQWWFSYFDSSSLQLWSHEWLKHGTCSRDSPSLKGELKYFSNTLKLAQSLRVFETLRNSSIVPANDKPYQAADVIKSLQTLSLGKTVSLNCDYEHHQPIPVLTGVNFCFDASLTPANCPETRRKCQRQIIFPATSTRISARRS